MSDFDNFNKNFPRLNKSHVKKKCTEDNTAIIIIPKSGTPNPLWLRWLWNVIAIFTLFASSIGLLHPDIYTEIMSDLVMPGVLSQDMVALLLSLFLLILNNFSRNSSFKVELFQLGIIWFLFYTYGIYVIEQAYNWLYLVYMVIFLLSFYSIVIYMRSFPKVSIKQVRISKFIFWSSIGFALFIPLLFYPMWISELIPLMRTGQKIEHLYSIYIIDMCFIFPAYIIFGLQAIKKQKTGIFAIPFLLVFGFLLLLPVGFGEIFRPRYGDPINWDDMMFYLGLSMLFLLFALLYLRSLTIKKKKSL